MKEDLIGLVAQVLFENWGGNGEVASLKARLKKPWTDTAESIIDEMSKYYVILQQDINYFDIESEVKATVIMHRGGIRCIYLNNHRVFGTKPIPSETYVEFNGRVGDVVCAIPELSRIFRAPMVTAVK